MSRDQIRAAALLLPVQERAALAVELLSTIDGDEDADAATAWDAEIDRRIARDERGEGTQSDSADVIARARRLI